LKPSTQHSDIKWITEEECYALPEEELTKDMKDKCSKLLSMMR